MLYGPSTDKRTVTIPDVIDFINPTGDNVVAVSGNLRALSIPEFVDFVDIYGTSVVQDVNGVSTVILTNAEPIPAIQPTLVVGQALIGTRDTSPNHAIFKHKDMSSTHYALLQTKSGLTYLNSGTTDIRFKHQNDGRMRLHQDGTCTVLDLPPPSTGQCKLRMRHSNGDYWDMEAPTSEFRWRWNGGNIAMHIAGNGDFRAFRDILAERNIKTNLNFRPPPRRGVRC